MSELTKLENQIAQLTKRAEALRNAEKKRAIGPMKAEIARLGIEPAELFPALRGAETSAGKRSAAKTTASGPRKVTGQPKYRDPKTGATWTGHGRAPKWFADAKKRLKGNVESLLFTTSPTAAAPEAKATEKRVMKKKAPAKAKDTKDSTKAMTPSRTAAKPGVKPAVKKVETKAKAKTSRVAKPRPAGRKPAAPNPAAKKRRNAAARVAAPVVVETTKEKVSMPTTPTAPAAE